MAPVTEIKGFIPCGTIAAASFSTWAILLPRVRTDFIIHYCTCLNFLPIHHTCQHSWQCGPHTSHLSDVSFPSQGWLALRFLSTECQLHKLFPSESLGLLREPSSSLFHPLPSALCKSNFHLTTGKIITHHCLLVCTKIRVKIFYQHEFCLTSVYILNPSLPALS